MLVVLASSCATPAPAPAPPADPLQVARTRVDECLHWAGEEGYDEARAKEIADHYGATCRAAVQAVDDGLQRSPNDAALSLLALELLDALSSESAMAHDFAARHDMLALCTAAAPLWKDVERSAVKSACQAIVAEPPS